MNDTYLNGPSTGTIASEVSAQTRLDRFYLPANEEAPLVTSPEAAAETLAPHFFGLDREACYVAHLDTKHRLIGVEMVSLGALANTFMAPREVFRGALLANAAAIVVAHNHPSGDPEPSRDDELLTKRLSRASEFIGIDLLDALIFGGERWISLARRGVL